MTKHEFEEHLGSTVSDKNYTLIEYIYTHHPAISETAGKKQIADLYKLGGMGIMNAMYNEAKDEEERENKRFSIRSAIRDLEAQLQSSLEDTKAVQALWFNR